MRVQEKMKKPVLEAKYLNVENTDRYRPIIRAFCILKYEKLKYWLYQEEVFEELKENCPSSRIYHGAVSAGSGSPDFLGKFGDDSGYQKGYHH